MLEPDEEKEPEGLEFDIAGRCEKCGAMLDRGFYIEEKQLLTTICDNGCVNQVNGFRLGRK